MANKIAFVGTACAGKTTLLEDLRTEYENDPGVAFVEEAARKFFEDNPVPIELRFVLDTQFSLLELIMANEITAEEGGAHTIICDRSVIDAPAYVSAGGDQSGSQKMYEKVRDWLPTYTKFYLLDPDDVPYVNDDVRIETLEVRQQIHEAYLGFFALHDIGYELLSGNQEQRLEIVKAML